MSTASGAREDGYRHLSMLNAAGIPVLLISYRNDARAPASEEGIYAFGLTEWPDVEAAADWLIARGHDRLILIGESMGGGVAGQFLARSDRAGAVVAVALDAPAVDFGAVLTHLATEIGLPLPAAVGAVAGVLTDLRLPIPLREARVGPVYAAFPGPLFVAHGTGDRIVPFGSTGTMIAARPGTTILRRTGADHLLSFDADPDAYRAAFAAFLATVPTSADTGVISPNTAIRD